MNYLGKKRSFLFFIAPGCLLLLFLLALPITQSVLGSLTESVSLSGDNTVFNDFAHYQNLFSDPAFWTSLKLAAAFTAVTSCLELAIALAVGLLLFFQKPLPRILEILLILPMFVLPVVSGLTWRYIYDPSQGPFSFIFERLGVEVMAPLSDGLWAFWAVVLQDVWRMWPFVFLIIYSGLKALPRSAVEAAKIDGAGTRSIITHVILPALRPTLAIALGLKITESLKVFTEVYVMTGGGPGDSTALLSIHVVKKAFHFFQTGPASAASILLLVLAMTLAFTVTELQNRVERKKLESGKC